MPNDELLRAKILGSLLTPIPNIPKRIEMANKLTDEILAKLKDMGWKAPEEVTMFLSLIAEDTLKKARVGYVKWDREKVVQVMKDPPCSNRSERCPTWDAQGHFCYGDGSDCRLADQLKEKLTGGD